jgi:hypothetical protein
MGRNFTQYSNVPHLLHKFWFLFKIFYSHGKIYVAPLQDEELTIPISTKPDNYKVVCIKCNMEIRSSELNLHEQSCQKSEQIEADFLEMEE